MTLPTIEAVATAAAKMPNPKKAEAFKLFRELMTSGNLEFALSEWATIYAHFQPNKKPKNLTSFDWVQAAVSTEETRPYLHYVYSDVENNNLVATDGQRLHLLPIPKNMEQGFYDKDKTPLRDEIGIFPDYSRVVPTSDKFLPYHDWNKAIARVSMVMDTPIYILEDNLWVNKLYWDEAIQDAPDITYQVHHDTLARIYFKHEPQRIAVIMGVKHA